MCEAIAHVCVSPSYKIHALATYAYGLSFNVALIIEVQVVTLLEMNFSTRKNASQQQSMEFSLFFWHLFVPFALVSHGLYLIYTTLSSFVVFLLYLSSMAWSLLTLHKVL